LTIFNIIILSHISVLSLPSDIPIASIESESPSEPEPPGERTATNLASTLTFRGSSDEPAERRKLDERSLLCDALSDNLTGQALRWGENRSGRIMTPTGFTFTYCFSRLKDASGMFLRLSDGDVRLTQSGIQFSSNRGRFDYVSLTVEVGGNGEVARGSVGVNGICPLKSNAIRYGTPLTFRVSDKSDHDVPLEQVEAQARVLVNGARGEVEKLLREARTKAQHLARRNTHQPVASLRIPWAEARNIEDALGRVQEEQMAQWRAQFPGVEWGE